MEFTLVYDGPLKANGTIADKHEIRRVFHPQIRKHWKTLDRDDCLVENPPKGNLSILRKVGSLRFAPIVSSSLFLVARLEIILLRPEAPGAIITRGGDIDNRLKTLFDALRMPLHPHEIPRNYKPSEDEDPLFCLLEDDNLITGLSVSTDRLLLPGAKRNDVKMLVRVATKVTRLVIKNMGLG